MIIKRARKDGKTAHIVRRGRVTIYPDGKDSCQDWTGYSSALDACEWTERTVIKPGGLYGVLHSKSIAVGVFREVGMPGKKLKSRPRFVDDVCSFRIATREDESKLREIERKMKGLSEQYKRLQADAFKNGRKITSDNAEEALAEFVQEVSNA